MPDPVNGGRETSIINFCGGGFPDKVDAGCERDLNTQEGPFWDVLARTSSSAVAAAGEMKTRQSGVTLFGCVISNNVDMRDVKDPDIAKLKNCTIAAVRDPNHEFPLFRPDATGIVEKKIKGNAAYNDAVQGMILHGASPAAYGEPIDPIPGPLVTFVFPLRAKKDPYADFLADRAIALYGQAIAKVPAAERKARAAEIAQQIIDEHLDPAKNSEVLEKLLAKLSAADRAAIETALAGGTTTATTAGARPDRNDQLLAQASEILSKAGPAAVQEEHSDYLSRRFVAGFGVPVGGVSSLNVEVAPEALYKDLAITSPATRAILTDLYAEALEQMLQHPDVRASLDGKTGADLTAALAKLTPELVVQVNLAVKRALGDDFAAADNSTIALILQTKGVGKVVVEKDGAAAKITAVELVEADAPPQLVRAGDAVHNPIRRLAIARLWQGALGKAPAAVKEEKRDALISSFREKIVELRSDMSLEDMRLSDAVVDTVAEDGKITLATASPVNVTLEPEPSLTAALIDSNGKSFAADTRIKHHGRLYRQALKIRADNGNPVTAEADQRALYGDILNQLFKLSASGKHDSFKDAEIDPASIATTLGSVELEVKEKAGGSFTTANILGGVGQLSGAVSTAVAFGDNSGLGILIAANYPVEWEAVKDVWSITFAPGLLVLADPQRIVPADSSALDSALAYGQPDDFFVRLDSLAVKNRFSLFGDPKKTLNGALTVNGGLVLSQRPYWISMGDDADHALTTQPDVNNSSRHAGGALGFTLAAGSKTDWAGSELVFGVLAGTAQGGVLWADSKGTTTGFGGIDVGAFAGGKLYLLKDQRLGFGADISYGAGFGDVGKEEEDGYIRDGFKNQLFMAHLGGEWRPYSADGGGKFLRLALEGGVAAAGNSRGEDNITRWTAIAAADLQLSDYIGPYVRLVYNNRSGDHQFAGGLGTAASGLRGAGLGGGAGGSDDPDPTGTAIPAALLGNHAFETTLGWDFHLFPNNAENTLRLLASWVHSTGREEGTPGQNVGSIGVWFGGKF